MPSWKWKRVHVDGPDGHRLFVKIDALSQRVARVAPWDPEDVPRLFVADRSGTTPDRTDDGEIEIDYHRLVNVDGGLLVLRPTHGYLVADVPVIVKGREGCKVGLSAGCVMHLAGAWGLAVEVQAPYLARPITPYDGT